MTNQIPIKDVTPRNNGTGGPGGEPGHTSFYKKHVKIQPKWIEGRFQQLRDFTVLATMGAYLITPWLTWHDKPVVRFDLPARRFDVLGLTFFPEDFFYLSLLLMIAAFGLLFFTNLLGRVFCGYVCPQTVWTRFFVRIERWTEGDRSARLKLDKAGMSVNKLLRRTAKHAAWVFLALLTATTFVGYFSPIRELIPRIFTFQLGTWETWWLLFFGTATYINAGWMREQVCLYMCPYARFQSAMFDMDTLVVSYDTGRGEPRGRGQKRRETSDEHKDLGDCIDCGLCVQVCPTGIDIRDGMQYECITCAACIDACDEVMESIGKPRGLVRYTTEHALEGQKTQIIRPRLIGYGIVLGSLVTLLLTGLTMRVPAALDVIRDRNALFQETSDGKIENVYTLKVYNKAQVSRKFTISVDVPKGVDYRGPADVTLSAGGAESIPVSLVTDPYGDDREDGGEDGEKSVTHGDNINAEVEFVITATDDPGITVHTESRFISGSH